MELLTFYYEEFALCIKVTEECYIQFQVRLGSERENLVAFLCKKAFHFVNVYNGMMENLK